ncbi:Gfo/Idh/MocA family oxidoreductase [Pelagibacterales bacterium SAG-MED43]|nr:Gfo/Idh/MocA family oxidoreductase [Pelagibacterales bacterium SAG-MED43]
MNCAIIGSTKIAEVHAEKLVQHGIKEITFISRSLQKRNKIIFNLKKKISKRILLHHSDIKILKKNFFDIICICSKTEVHDKHLRLVAGLKSVVIIEKPIISILKLKKKYKNFLVDIYKKNKKIVVCYPYLFLAKNFKKYFKKVSKIKEITFEFQTGGTSKFKKICINLMPHALSFFHIFLKKNFLKKPIKKNALFSSKHLWQTNFSLGKMKINLVFRENYQKKTSLKFKVDDLKLARKTRINKGKFINYIKNYNSNKIKIISNPMEDFYKDFFKNINNKKYYQINKNITFDIMKKNYTFLN